MQTIYRKESIIIENTNIEINKTPLKLEDGSGFIKKMMRANMVEGSSVKNNELFVNLSEYIIETNHFLLMLQIAFNEHKAICITPDNIWLLICQGFSEHIKLNADYFKNLITGLDEKTTISVERNDFKKGGINPWEEIFPEFTEQIKNIVKDDLYSNMVLNFSTSTTKEIVAFEISFMDTVSSYFDYEFLTLCGIPKIKIVGNYEDYDKILKSIYSLKKYDLDWWLCKITVLIEQFIGAIKGNIDAEFWNSIFKEDNKSGGPYITGWISHFFPYVKKSLVQKNEIIIYSEQNILKEDVLKIIGVEDLKYENTKIVKVIVKNPILENTTHKLTLDDFPNGLSKVPFKWKYLNNDFEMNFISGSIGIKENENTLKSEINWVVSELNNKPAVIF